MNNLGMLYYNQKQYKKAAQYISKAHKQGFTKATYNLGLCYLNGNGVERDSDQAR